MYFQKRESKKNKKGYTWTVKFYYKDEYGIKKRFAKSGFASKADAEKFGIKIKYFLKSGVKPRV